MRIVGFATALYFGWFALSTPVPLLKAREQRCAAGRGDGRSRFLPRSRHFSGFRSTGSAGVIRRVANGGPGFFDLAGKFI
jgi:hypothetical protein